MMRSIAKRKIFWLILSIAFVVGGCQTVADYLQPDADNLIITEFVAANRAGLLDEDGDASDWLEIHNSGDSPVNLAGFALTDDPDQPEKWPFPSLSLGGGEYVVVFASGKNRISMPLHTNFKLRQSGEFLGLYNLPQERFVDSPALSAGQPYPAQFTDVAFGLAADSTQPAYLAGPTPGQPNQPTQWAGLVEPVAFSQPRGFYNVPVSVTLTTVTPGATIRYTLDGSDPTDAHGAAYTGPLTISQTTLLRTVAVKPGYHPSAVVTHSYIFIDDVLTQAQDPDGFPKTWGGFEGAPVVADYEMDPDILKDPRYGASLPQSLLSLPSLSLVTSGQNFYDLYTNPGRRGRAWERPVSVEWLEPEEPGFQINAGLRIQGGLGRDGNIPKHNFRLFFRDEYGPTVLDYPLFAGSPVHKFDTLVLRAGVNRSYAGYPGRPEEIRRTTYTRDEWLRQSQLAMSGYAARGRFVHLYMNGLYWGLYNLVERPDEDFMAAYFGGEPEDWQSINHAETLDNTSPRFQTLHQLAAEGQLDVPERYDALKSHLDIPQFIDYLTLNWYAGNLDWGFNNWYAGVGVNSEPVRYFVWDGERTWLNGAEIYMEYDEYRDRPNRVKPLLEALLQNPDFRLMLADRLYLHLFNNGALADANTKSRWLQLNRRIEPAIVAESARWGDTRFDPPLTPADWAAARDDVLTQMDGNAAHLIALAREAGYYPRHDPPRINRHDNLTLTLTGSGDIYYTTDGSDPRQSVTGQIAPTAQRYASPLKLSNGTPIKARVFDHGEWSALAEAAFNSDKEQKKGE